APRGPAGGGARRRALPYFAWRRRELRQHAAAAAPARLSRGAGHLRQRHGRLPQGVPRSGKAGRVARDLGERRAAARGGYDVHFAPFPYRPGTKTTILYTTQRD